MELYAAGSFRRESVFLRDYFNLPVLKLRAVLQVPRSISSIDGQLLAIKILCTLLVKAHSHVPYKKNETYQRNFVLWRHLLFKICSSSKLVACSQLATSSPGKRRPNANLDPMPRSFTSASVKKWRLFLLFRRHICISMMSFQVLTGTYLVTLAWQRYWLTQQWKEHLLVRYRTQVNKKDLEIALLHVKTPYHMSDLDKKWYRPTLHCNTEFITQKSTAGEL